MKRLISLFLVILLGLGGGTFFNLYVSPDNAWLIELNRIKSAALKNTRGDKRILIVGGSSVLFGIDAGLLKQKTGRESVNLGMSAGLGALFMLGYADEAAQQGDLVVLSIEPSLFSSPPKIGRDAAIFATSIGRHSLIYGGREKLIVPSISEEAASFLNITTPGLRRIINYAARRAMHLPVFRYTGKRVDELGYAVEKVTLPHVVGLDASEVRFDPAWKPVLQKYRERLAKRGVKVVYRLSWSEVDSAKKVEIQAQTEKFQASVGEVLPVLREQDAGLKTDPRLFSDFLLHLSISGAEQSTKSLADLIKQLLAD